MSAPIYLDHHATTPVLPEVVEAMRPYWTEPFGNPASAHAFGRRARQALEEARERIAARLDADPESVVFTSGATEANNLAIFGLAGDPPGAIVASAIEHPCVAGPLAQLALRGFDVSYLPIDAEGVTRLPPAGRDAKVVALMRVNHETGTIQPVPSHPRWHCDAAQAVGKLPVSFRALGAATLSASAHKFGGPTGAGLLLVRKGIRLRPHLYGGHQENDRRPGTVAVANAVGLATALDIAGAEMDRRLGHVRRIHDRLRERLLRDAPPAVVNGPTDPQQASPYALNVSFPGLRGDTLLMALDLEGVACSAGSACSSGSLLPSPVLRAMNVGDERLRSALRFSFGPRTTEAEIDLAAERIVAVVRRLRS